MTRPRSVSIGTMNRLTVVGGIAALLSVLPLTEITLTQSWLLQAAIAIAAVTVTGYLLRTTGLPRVAVPIAQIAVLSLWLGVLVAGDEALLGFIPTLDWATRLFDAFGMGVDTVNAYRAPVPVVQGILLMLVGGAGLVALLVDIAVVGLRRVALAGLPLGACYAVAAAVVPGGLPWWWFLPPAAGFLAILIAEGRGRIAAWGRSATPSATHSRLPKTDSLARNGRRVGAVALTAAVAIPGLVPVLTDGILGPGGSGRGGGGQTIRTDNPIVDLQRNLQRPANVDVLRYRSSSDEPQYIRTVTLDVFNGEVWQTSDRAVPESVDSGLPTPQGMRLADVGVVDYTFQVTDNYSSRWLPLPYPAQQIDIEGDWRYHDETLDVVSTEDDVRASTYTVRSLDIRPTVEMLRSAGEPSKDVAPSLELPDGLPEIVTRYATEVTQNATDDFSRAAALQTWFRTDGGFVYDIETQPGHSSTALVDFLTERRGYCEQFAATMAIMARALGIPSRVAVGFTPGDYQGDSTWLVRAHDSHAWPELYFEGIGWVRFEPTPAARSGRAPDWTFVPSAPGSPGSPGTPSQPLPTSSATGPGVPIGEEPSGGSGLAGAEAGWSDLRDTVAEAGLPADPAATPRATARRLASAASLTGDDLASLDRLVTAAEQARYARRTDPVPSLRADAAALRRAILRSRSVGRRIVAFLWPAQAQDAVAGASRRMTEALDWLDTAGPRLRRSLTTTISRSEQ